MTDMQNTGQSASLEADAEKRAAVVEALRDVADRWTRDGDDEDGVRRLRARASAIEAGQVIFP